MTHGASRFVGHTTLITPDRAFIRTDEFLEVGSSIDIELSLGCVLSPRRFRGTVTELRAHGGPGDFAGVWIVPDPEDTHVLRRVLERSSTTRELRVLLVEDSEMARAVFAYASSRGPSHVVLDAVADADLAWERLQAQPYHLVLVDYFLPDATGADLITRIRSAADLRTLPVIGLSIGGSVARDAMLDAGVDMFLDKPVQPRDLFATFELLAAIGDEVAS